jgi:hypothetical protein
VGAVANWWLPANRDDAREALRRYRIAVGRRRPARATPPAIRSSAGRLADGLSSGGVARPGRIKRVRPVRPRAHRHAVTAAAADVLNCRTEDVLSAWCWAQNLRPGPLSDSPSRATGQSPDRSFRTFQVDKREPGAWPRSKGMPRRALVGAIAHADRGWVAPCGGRYGRCHGSGAADGDVGGRQEHCPR